MLLNKIVAGATDCCCPTFAVNFNTRNRRVATKIKFVADKTSVILLSIKIENAQLVVRGAVGAGPRIYPVAFEFLVFSHFTTAAAPDRFLTFFFNIFLLSEHLSNSRRGILI